MTGGGSEPSGYRDPIPWASGLTVAALIAALTTVGVYAFGVALAQVHPLLAVVVNLVTACGVAPTALHGLGTPVVRWVVVGGALGVLLGWCGLVVTGLAAL